MVVVPTGKVLPGVCDLVHTKLPDAVQLSVAVGSVQLTTALHRPVSLFWLMFAGQPLKTGFWVSETVIVTVTGVPAQLLAVGVML